MRVEGRREVVFWILHTSFWATLGIVGLFATLAFKSAMPDLGWAVFMRVASGFLLTAGLRVIYLQPWLRQRGGLAKCALMAACCIVVGLAEAILLQAVITAGIPFPGGAETFGLKMMVVRFFSLWMWSALYFTAHVLEDEHVLELRATRAELAARENELRHLQAQMNPHFVFNSLSAVLACKDDPEAVQDVTRSLAEYLRFLLQESRPLEPLSRELDALEKFLVAQTAHLSKNLVCRIQCESAARAVMVPPMIVQPLLENAFMHRPKAAEQSLQIWLTARVEQGFLRITLSNTGEAVPIAAGQGTADGIPSLRQRLRLLLGPEARVEEQTDNGWIRVTIHIPLGKAEN
ncbi:MAG: histidine kinase [Verrucomicrobiota bacterium]